MRILRAVKAAYEIQKDATKAELERLDSEFEGYSSDIEQLGLLQKQNQETLKLYSEQLKAGSISIAEGIGLHWEHANTQISLIDIQSDIVKNCLQISQVKGLLVPFGVK